MSEAAKNLDIFQQLAIWEKVCEFNIFAFATQQPLLFFVEVVLTSTPKMLQVASSKLNT